MTSESEFIDWLCDVLGCSAVAIRLRALDSLEIYVGLCAVEDLTGQSVELKHPIASASELYAVYLTTSGLAANDG
jgi:hypothetical protein